VEGETCNNAGTNQFTMFRIMSFIFPLSTYDVRPVDDFEELNVLAPAGSKYHLQALLTGKPCEGREGQFRFLLAGTDHYRIDFRASEVLNVPILKGLSLRMQLELGSQVKTIFT
jgi:hypothetical protein